MSGKNIRKKPRIDLATQIFIGFFLGIGLGIFFGERMEMFSIIGDAFIMLLQMTVLPYIAISLIAGLGKLNLQQAGMIAKKGGLILLTLWVIAFVMILLIPLTFPEWQTANFFSKTLIKPPGEIDFLRLYIPANPFHSMAENIVPATVLFCVALGIALMGIDKKEGLLNSMDVIIKALTRITNFIVKLAPIGVFGIAASASGTMDLDGLGRLQVYLYAYMAIALLTAFFIIPRLVTSFTPLKYRDIIGKNKDLLITAFATANLFVVLSLLISKSIDSLVDKGIDEETARSNVDVLVPVSFNFPSAGKLFSLAFVLFAVWFVGASMSLSQYGQFVVVGFFSFFGHPIPAIHSLFETFRIPDDIIELYLLSDIITSRFGTLLAAVHILAIAMMGTMAMNNMLRISWKRVLKFLIPTVTITLIVVFGLKTMFGLIKYEYLQYKKFIHMETFSDQAALRVYPEWTPVRLADDSSMSKLDQIKSRGFVRVGYFNGALPFVFMNENKQLVGFDVELAHSLAREWGVELEFVKVRRTDVASLLNNNFVDIIMSGNLMTNAHDIVYSEPYTNQSFAFIVEDHRKDDFSNNKSIMKLDSLRIGILDMPYYVDKLQRYLPHAEIIVLNSPREYFKTKDFDLDAFLYTAEAGSAWSMIYPEYAVAVPFDRITQVPVSFILAKGRGNFYDHINRWILLKTADKTINRIADYWIYGQLKELKQARWCVAQDVLHWYE